MKFSHYTNLHANNHYVNNVLQKTLRFLSIIHVIIQLATKTYLNSSPAKNEKKIISYQRFL